MPATRIVTAALSEPGTSRTSKTATMNADIEAPVSPLGRLAGRLSIGSAVVPVVQSGLRLLRLRQNEQRMRHVLSTLELDVIHASNGGYPGATSALAAVLAAERLEIPTRILTVHSTARPTTILKTLERGMDTRVGQAATHVIAVGDAVAASLVDLRALPGAKISVIRTGIPLDPPLLRADARKTLGIADDSLVIAMVASLRPGKDHSLLLSAVARVRATYPNVILLIAGDGPTRSDVESKVKRRSAGSWVRLLGHVDAAVVFSACDVAVLASRAEGLPLTILEAMAQGRPVIASDVGAVGEAVLDGRTGFTVPTADEIALADRLDKILGNAQLRHRLGAGALATVHATRNAESMVDAYEKLYAGLPLDHQ